MNTDNNIQSATTAVTISSSSGNVGMIMRDTPGFYEKNRTQHDTCLKACSQLLSIIDKEGMNDDLDREAATYIERTRRTLKAMSERRSPVTKIFDQIRKEFTTLENDIDPARGGTIPYRLQQLRNQYAAKKREEEAERQREEEYRRQRETARSQYRDACISDYQASFSRRTAEAINALTDLNARVTLESYAGVFDAVTGFSPELPADWCPPSSVLIPLILDSLETRQIRSEVFTSLIPGFRQRYAKEVGEYRQEILDRLPSRKAELERIAKADAEEAARIQANVARREAAEAARREAERIAREQEEAKKAEVQKSNAEAANLFNVAQASAPASKVKVTKKINITGEPGYMAVMSMWWAREGNKLSKEELDKVFKKQIAFCEKLANKEGEFIKNPDVHYVDEVKAQ